MTAFLLTTLLLGGPRVLIGNYLVTAPCGIAFVIDDKQAAVIDTGAPYVAGIAAPDQSYNCQVLKIGEARVQFEWSKVGTGVVARFQAGRPLQIPLHLSAGWPGWTTRFKPTASGAEAVFDSRTWSLQSVDPPQSANDQQVVLMAAPSKPAEFVAGLGGLPNRKAIDEILALNRERYLRNAPRSEGDWGDFVGAIGQNLENSRIYGSDNHLLAYTVSRAWSGGKPNNAPYFCWDSFFNANLGSLSDPTVARDTIRGLLSYQTPSGLVPNFGHWQFKDSRSSDDRSQPPVGSLCVWNLHMRWPDLGFLREIYPKLVKWHRWWSSARDGNHDGLLEWGSATGGWQEAQWETGWDDNLHFSGAKMVGATMDADAVDLNSMWSMDAEYLGAIAQELGRSEEARTFRQEHEAINARINQLLWNESLGLYCSRLWEPSKSEDSSSALLTRINPMNFYPLLAGVPDKSRAATVLRSLTDSSRFWGQWIVPTLPYDDPNYHEQEYWRGDVWAPTNYLLFQGLRRYASPVVRNRFALSSERLFMTNWSEAGICSENYLSTTGKPGGDPHYTWGALLNLAALENLCSFDSDGSTELNGTSDVNVTVENLPIRGKLYRLVAKPGHVELYSRDRIVAIAAHTVRRVMIH